MPPAASSLLDRTGSAVRMADRKTRISLRVDFGDTVRVGPGKVQLLELIAEFGSISAAARAMDMSYRRAWLLVASLNRAFVQQVVATRPGGKADQRAEVTPFGRQLIDRFRSMEAAVHEVIARDLRFLERGVREDGAVRWMRDPRDRPD
jgi:molybdate transport system regulatory protein